MHEKDAYVSLKLVIEIPTIVVKECGILAQTALNTSQKKGEFTLNRK